MKRLIRILAVTALAAVLIASVSAHAETGPATEDWFSDIADSVHRVQIATIAEAGITLGCNPPVNSRFCPERNVTRGEMAAFIRRASFPLRTDLAPQFDDIASSVFIHDINTLAVRGVVTSTNIITNRFEPDWDLNRATMAEWMFRAGWCWPALERTQVFDDIPADHPQAPYVWSCWRAGVYLGNGGHGYPDGAVTREQMASFIVRGADL